MPDNPTPDDPLADVFGSLPPAAQRNDPAPTSRRAAREGAAQGAPHGAPQRVPTAPQAPAPVAAPTPGTQPRVAQIEDLFAGHATTQDVGKAITSRDKDRRKSRVAGWVVFVVVLAILGGLTAGGVAVWNTYQTQIRAFMGWGEPTDYPKGEAEGEVLITIVEGDTGSSISKTLFTAGVTKTSGAFYSYLLSEGEDPTFVPGIFALKKKMSSAEALAAIENPANKREHSAQLAEGLTMDQSLPILAKGLGLKLSDLQAAVKKPSEYGVKADSLEGWLFPATYTFDPGTTAKQVIAKLVDRTVQSLDKASVPREDRQRILTIASIIQREARYEEDFFKVSRVIENRLSPSNGETFGKLQMDSTAQYGYGEMHDGSASSSAAALADNNPWNTYKHAGLPKGPISNPGDVAIDAAMHPADGDWLYFVTVNLDTGETIFSRTYAEHEVAVKKWDAWCTANPDSGC